MWGAPSSVWGAPSSMRLIPLLPADAYATQVCKQGLAPLCGAEFGFENENAPASTGAP